MAKYTYKEIKEIIEIGNPYKGAQISTIKNAFYTGYFTKTSANWSYQVYIIFDESKKRFIEIVAVFGEIQ